MSVMSARDGFSFSGQDPSKIENRKSETDRSEIGSPFPRSATEGWAQRASSRSSARLLPTPRHDMLDTCLPSAVADLATVNSDKGHRAPEAARAGEGMTAGRDCARGGASLRLKQSIDQTGMIALPAATVAAVRPTGGIIMRRFTVLLTVVAVVLLGSAVTLSRPPAAAQEATPETATAVTEMVMESITVEDLAASEAPAFPPVPVDVGLVRLRFAPGGHFVAPPVEDLGVALISWRRDDHHPQHGRLDGHAWGGADPGAGPRRDRPQSRGWRFPLRRAGVRGSVPQQWDRGSEPPVHPPHAGHGRNADTVASSATGWLPDSRLAATRPPLARRPDPKHAGPTRGIVLSRSAAITNGKRVKHVVARRAALDHARELVSAHR